MNIEHEIEQHFRATIERADTLWNMTAIPAINLTFFTKGRVAGLAVFNKCEVQINTHVAAQDLNAMRNTVSHEIAHIIAAYLYRDTGHGKAWKQVHRLLGGDGERCYNGNGTFARQRSSKYFLYRLPSGLEHWVGPKYHKSVQSGRYILIMKSGEHLSAAHYTGKCEIRK